MELDSCPEFQKPFELGLGLKAEVGLVLGSNQQKGLVFLELQQQGLR
jgi:hypothetical protein